MAVRYFCDRCGAEFNRNSNIKISVHSVVEISLDLRGIADLICNECFKAQIPDNRIQGESSEDENTPEEWINGNKYLRRNKDDCLILVDENGKHQRYLVRKNGFRYKGLTGYKTYIKLAGLTLTEDTWEGVLTLDCIPEPWRSKVMEYEKGRDAE